MKPTADQVVPGAKFVMSDGEGDIETITVGSVVNDAEDDIVSFVSRYAGPEEMTMTEFLCYARFP